MFASIVSLLSGWLKSRSDIAHAKTLAKIENVKNGIPGYSDEFLIVIWSYPMIASFVPSLQPSVSAGFAFMDSMPDWYTGGFIAISFSVFGIDKIFKIRKK